MKQFEHIVFPRAFNHPDILIHADCQNELMDLLKKSGKKAQFDAEYRKRLDFLQEKREQAVLHGEWFEKLKHEDSLYAMRIVRIDNIRIIYVIVGRWIYLLHAFKETSSGNDSKSYKHGTIVAKKRVQDIERSADDV